MQGCSSCNGDSIRNLIIPVFEHVTKHLLNSEYRVVAMRNSISCDDETAPLISDVPGNRL